MKGEPKTMTKSLAESRPLEVVEATPGTETEGIPVVLIDAGWGSSGYYSEAVLKAAATAGIFGEGLQMYVDHPGSAEMYDRPERSIRDLAASLAATATYEESAKAIVGYAKPMGPNKAMLEDKDFLRNIGLSIRAFGDSRVGEAEGRKGQIITELTEAISVDFVTRAGRGGRVLVDLMESAKPDQVVRRAIALGVSEATANETRQALTDALQGAYGGDKSWVWVRDFDESAVWFQYETPEGTGTYEHAYTLTSGGKAELSGEPAEVRAKTTYVRVNAESEAPTHKHPAPAGESTATESKETNMATIEIEESALDAFKKDAERVPALESENKALRHAAAVSQARSTASDLIAAESETFSPLETQGLLAQVIVGEDGAFDQEAFKKVLESEVSKKATQSPASTVRGFGMAVESSTTSDADRALIERAESAAAGAFGRTVKGA